MHQESEEVEVMELERRSCRPAAGAPLLLPGWVCRNVYNPEKLKEKVYVNCHPYAPGAQNMLKRRYGPGSKDRGPAGP